MNRKLNRRIAPTLIALGLVVAACSADDNNGSPGTDPADETDGGGDGTETDGGSDSNGGDGGGDGGSAGGPIGFARASLVQFDECDAFLDYVHTEGAERVGAYGFDNNGWWPIDVLEGDIAVGEEEAMEEDAAFDEPADEAADFDTAGEAVPSAAPDADGARATDDAEGGGDGTFSTTNVQVEGVDEPDIVKTDGDRILAVAGEQLHYVDVTPDGASGQTRGSVNLFDTTGNTWSWGHEIFFNGDRAFVIAQSETGYAYLEDGIEVEPFVTDAVDAVEVVDPATVEEDGDAEAGFAPEEEPTPEPLPEPEPEPLPVEPDAPIGGPIPPPGGYFGPTTTVHEVDLSDPDELRILNTLEVRGRYVSARSIGDTARLVITSAPTDLGFVYPSSGNQNAIDAATDANQRLVAESTLDDWLPTYSLIDGNGGRSEGTLADCSNIHAPTEFSGFDMLSVVTFQTDEALGAPVGTASVMATGDTVYASQDRLYVTSNVWLPPTIDEQQRGVWEEEYETAIHRFSIAGDGPATYEASGSVDGHLLNQFSMNDRDGTFFVATTSGTPWGAQPDTDNKIIAMQMEGENLVEIGRVDDLGLEGERIFSVRYVGDVAYLVTFRQTDPFYVLDIADPTNMSVLGELKIPGFSSYLHPITETLVLGVGQDATEEGFTTGTKVSLFDVSDRANPQEIDVWSLPGGGSDAEWDHRAFLYWPATETAVLPVTQWQEQFSGAVVLRVNGDGIEELGRVTQEDPRQEATGATDCDVLDASNLTEEDGELFWIAQEGQINLCGENQAGGAVGYYCETFPVEEAQFWTNDGQVPDEFADYERFEWCWPDGGIDWQKQIRRTLVIDDSLWTLSNGYVQANDLATLAQTVRLPLT